MTDVLRGGFAQCAHSLHRKAPDVYSLQMAPSSGITGIHQAKNNIMELMSVNHSTEKSNSVVVFVCLFVFGWS